VSVLPLFVCVRTQLFKAVAVQAVFKQVPDPLQVPPPQAVPAGYTAHADPLEVHAPVVPQVLEACAAQLTAQQSPPSQFPLWHALGELQATPFGAGGAHMPPLQ